MWRVFNIKAKTFLVEILKEYQFYWKLSKFYKKNDFTQFFQLTELILLFLFHKKTNLLYSLSTNHWIQFFTTHKGRPQSHFQSKKRSKKKHINEYKKNIWITLLKHIWCTHTAHSWIKTIFSSAMRFSKGPIFVYIGTINFHLWLPYFILYWNKMNRFVCFWIRKKQNVKSKFHFQYILHPKTC